jgi:hypothetical protein
MEMSASVNNNHVKRHAAADLTGLRNRCLSPGMAEPGFVPLDHRLIRRTFETTDRS